MVRKIVEDITNKVIYEIEAKRSIRIDENWYPGADDYRIGTCEIDTYEADNINIEKLDNYLDLDSFFPAETNYRLTEFTVDDAYLDEDDGTSGFISVIFKLEGDKPIDKENLEETAEEVINYTVELLSARITGDLEYVKDEVGFGNEYYQTLKKEEYEDNNVNVKIVDNSKLEWKVVNTNQEIDIVNEDLNNGGVELIKIKQREEPIFGKVDKFTRYTWKQYKYNNITYSYTVYSEDSDRNSGLESIQRLSNQEYHYAIKQASRAVFKIYRSGRFITEAIGDTAEDIIQQLAKLDESLNSIQAID